LRLQFNLTVRTVGVDLTCASVSAGHLRTFYLALLSGRQTRLTAQITWTLSDLIEAKTLGTTVPKMSNPYQPPATSSLDQNAAIRRKILTGTICLAVCGLACVAIVIVGSISWYGNRNNEVQSALQPLMPILVAIHLLLGVAICVAIYGLRVRATWSINFAIGCLAMAGLSILFPVCGVGIWALLDSKMTLFGLNYAILIANIDAVGRTTLDFTGFHCNLRISLALALSYFGAFPFSIYRQ